MLKIEAIFISSGYTRSKILVQRRSCQFFSLVAGVENVNFVTHSVLYSIVWKRWPDLWIDYHTELGLSLFIEWTDFHVESNSHHFAIPLFLSYWLIWHRNSYLSQPKLLSRVSELQVTQMSTMHTIFVFPYFTWLSANAYIGPPMHFTLSWASSWLQCCIRLSYSHACMSTHIRGLENVGNLHSLQRPSCGAVEFSNSPSKERLKEMHASPPYTLSAVLNLTISKKLLAVVASLLQM